MLTRPSASDFTIIPAGSVIVFPVSPGYPLRIYRVFNSRNLPGGSLKCFIQKSLKVEVEVNPVFDAISASVRFDNRKRYLMSSLRCSSIQFPALMPNVSLNFRLNVA